MCSVVRITSEQRGEFQYNFLLLFLKGNSVAVIFVILTDVWHLNVTHNFTLIYKNSLY